MENIYQAPQSDLGGESEDQGLFYGVSSAKLIVMSVFTFTFYNFYWFYKNFNACKKRYDDDSIPVLRTLFSPIFSYSLFTSINSERENADVDKKLYPGFLALIYFVLNASGRVLPDPFFLISLLTFLPLLAANRAINELNAKINQAYRPDSQFSWINWIFLILGLIFTTLVIMGLLIESEQLS